MKPTMCLILMFSVGAISCSGDVGSPTNPGTQPPSTLAIFHFDSKSVGEFNPTITKGAVTISFVTDENVNHAGFVQVVDDFRAEPYRGKGNARLSKGNGGQVTDNIAVDLNFNADVYTISFHAFQTDSLYVTKNTTPFGFEFFDAGGTSLGAVTTTKFTSWRNPQYEALQFDGTGGVRRIRLTGIDNSSYFDELVVHTVPPTQ
jgi:hypothetical protein